MHSVATLPEEGSPQGVVLKASLYVLPGGNLWNRQELVVANISYLEGSFDWL